MMTKIKMTKNDLKTIMEEMENIGLDEVEISVIYDDIQEEVKFIDFDFWVNGDFISTALTLERIT